MKSLKTNFIVLLSALIYASINTSDKQPSSAWQRARMRLDAAQGKPTPETPQTKKNELPTLQDVVAGVDDETTFITTLRAFLAVNPGCETWHESCKCSSWNEPMPKRGTDLTTIQGFDEPITCESMLGSCYHQLRGCSQESLDSRLQKALCEPDGNPEVPKYPQRRCNIAALACQGAILSTRCRHKNTALQVATLHSDFYLVKLLLELGANPNDPGDHEPTLVSFCNTPRIAKELLSHGANPNAKDNFSDTALHLASISHKDGDLIKVLLEYGADPNTKNNSGHTPLTFLASACSQREDKPSIINKATLLLDAGAETHHRVQGYYKDKTASEIARIKQNHPACKALADFLENYEKQPNREA